MVTLLKKQGARLNDALKDGSTPLHLAAEHPTTATVEALCSDEKAITSALLDAQDAQGNTPLHRAIAAGSAKMAEWLLSKGASVHTANRLGQTPLHLAAQHNQVAIIERLLAHKAVLTARDTAAGNTPLHSAAQAGASEAVVLLLEAGAPAQFKNNARQTPRELAGASGRAQTATQIDKTLGTLREKEESELKAQGVLGVFLLKQQQLIEEQRVKLERQEEQILAQQEEIAQLKRTKAELSTVEGLRGEVVGLKSDTKAVDDLKERLVPLEALREAEETRILWSRRLHVSPSFTLHSSSPLLVRPPRVLEVKGDEKEIEELLRRVAYGEQKQAEDLIQKKPELLLCKGKVTDLSKREFKSITGFQYAVWALDWHMWQMLLKYLKDEEAGEQLMEWDKQMVHPHGKHASWQGLIGAYAAYPQNPTSVYWIKQIGWSQLLLPAHVANEYCHGSRAFYPLPDFGSVGVELTRSRLSDGVDWYDVRCGVEWGHYRGKRLTGASQHEGHGIPIEFPRNDKGAIAALLETRLRQRADLVKRLTATKTASP